MLQGFPLRIGAAFRRSIPVALALSTSLTLTGQRASRTLYVDGTISAAECTTYNPSARACGSGRDDAFKTLAGVVTRTEPGVTVVIRGGVYKEPLVPARSGTAELPIVFKNHDGESVTLSDIEDAPAIQLINRDFIVVEGLNIVDTQGWARLEDARGNTIQRMTFARAVAHGTRGGLKIVRSSANRILENKFEEGHDSVMIQDASNGNIIAKNAFVTARHALLCIKCSSGNVVRQNLFVNGEQKGIEIYDCEGGSDAPFRLDATKSNLVEENLFAISRGSSRAYAYNAIQHGGQYTIVRRNVFVRDLGGGVGYHSYASESLFVYGNRLYHNTFFENRCFALQGHSGDPKQYRDNRATNNLFYKNADCEGSGEQILVEDKSALIVSGNAIETKDPGFVDLQKPDLRLKADSSMIDRAGALTTTRDAGQGTTMPVQDVFWFYSGFTIPGERGDEIQLMGTTDTARIVRIDYTASTLVLDRPLTWRSGQGVALKFSGIAPDFGAAEWSADQPSTAR